MNDKLREMISVVSQEKKELEPLFFALFSGNPETAKQASYNLWVILCNQGNTIPTALSVYNILLEGLLTLPPELKEEILDILYQFAASSTVSGEPWRKQLRERFLQDKDIYQSFAADKNEDIAAFSQLILEQL